MSNLPERLDAIIHKLRVTLDKQSEIELQLSSARQKLKELEEENLALKQQKQQLEEQKNILQLAKSLDLPNDDREVLKKKLKYYIREIDKSLSKINV